ncbi:heavy-metal-associated domain-containing protein [Larkinella soli]|uniref:heavy-metal-associated domain-containing protein n=1 Tax=Larkinella soli TaxID=1770527 RepID=UPI000FFC38B6|nr:heavy-metal-associated domain-containing protein [Larkinella soli]
MSEVKFKTNIKCSACVATVTPFLNKAVGEDHWQVDLQSPERILTVQAENDSADRVKQALQEAGYKGEPINQPL